MWFTRVRDDMGRIPEMLDYYSMELESAQLETKISGSLEKNAQDLPGMMSHRFSQLQDIEAVLKFLEIRYDKMRSTHYRRYLERYNRELSDRAIEKYIDGEQDIVDMQDIRNEVALLRNKYLSLTKGLENKSFMIGHITRLRVVGINDAVL